MQKTKLKIILELCWWIFTAIVVYLLLHPITEKIYQYPFLWINAAFIIFFITFTRYIFLLKYTWVANIEWAKLVFILAGMGIVYILMNGFSDVRTYMSENGLTKFMNHLPPDDRSKLGSYIGNQLLFFGVGSTISAIALIFRLIISVWRGRNQNGV